MIFLPSENSGHVGYDPFRGVLSDDDDGMVTVEPDVDESTSNQLGLGQILLVVPGHPLAAAPDFHGQNLRVSLGRVHEERGDRQGLFGRHSMLLSPQLDTAISLGGRERL